MAFRIAYCAGHYLGTPGKRIPKELDPNATREWVLNDRIARHFAAAAAEYGMRLLRTDDPTGKTFLDIPDRVKKANRWGADLYLDIHHNAGIGGGTGGGVEAFCYPESKKGKAFRDGIYAAVVKAGGLRGNRANPLQEKAFDSLRLTDMPAVLVEYGFMDSKTDVPVIATDAYAKKVARATAEAIAKEAGVKGVPDFVRQVQSCLNTDAVGQKLLKKTPTLSAKKNRTHPLIRVVQKRLFALGYPQVGAADGIAGPKFTSAVKAFQRDRGCVCDGEITAAEKTWKALLEAV